MDASLLSSKGNILDISVYLAEEHTIKRQSYYKKNIESKCLWDCDDKKHKGRKAELGDFCLYIRLSQNVVFFNQPKISLYNFNPI